MVSEHSEMTNKEYNKKIYDFKNRRDVNFFLLNTLFSIKYNGHLYCYCNSDGSKCQICLIRTDFSNCTEEIFSNMKNMEVLWNYAMKLYPYLSQLFYEHKKSISCFFNSEFSCSFIHWSGRVETITLPGIIKNCQEKTLREEFVRPLIIPHTNEDWF